MREALAGITSNSTSALLLTPLLHCFTASVAPLYWYCVLQRSMACM